MPRRRPFDLERGAVAHQLARNVDPQTSAGVNHDRQPAAAITTSIYEADAYTIVSRIHDKACCSMSEVRTFAPTAIPHCIHPDDQSSFIGPVVNVIARLRE